MTDRRYPIGPFQPQADYSIEEIEENIRIIDAAPAAYEALFRELSEDDFSKTYREGSWTVQQLFHHVADIHLVHFFRMKRALTEPDYKEVTLINMDGWVATPDSNEMPVEPSLAMFQSIGDRYVYLAKNLTPEQLDLAYFHPVRQAWISQKAAIAMSAWHVQHHFAHLEIATGRLYTE